MKNGDFSAKFLQILNSLGDFYQKNSSFLYLSVTKCIKYEPKVFLLVQKKKLNEGFVVWLLTYSLFRHLISNEN